MKSLFAVTADEDVIGVFPTNDDARKFIYYCEKWPERFEKHFGVSYGDVKDFTMDMAKWFDENPNDLGQCLMIQEVKYYENGLA